MTKLLQQAITKIEQLTPEQQDAIAIRLLADLQDEINWDYRFANTTNEQWQKMVQMVQQEIFNQEISPLDEILTN
jgi:hypothetical protein